MIQPTEQVRIFDTTMRDGEQSPGIAFSPEDKIALAEGLVAIGVDVIEAGFPRNAEDYEATQAVADAVGDLALKHNVYAPIVAGLARADETDITRCWDAIKGTEFPRIHTFMGASAIHLNKKFEITPDEAIAQAVEAVEIASYFTSDVQFSPEDATRADRGFLLEMVEAAVERGATTINIPDTTGRALPGEYGWLIKQVVARATKINPAVVVSTHCHNDLGNATANTMAALMAGARQVEGTINGIGERAGNTALEEVIANILTRPDIFPFETNIDSTQFMELSGMVARLSGYAVPPNKAVVGANGFKHEAGIHQDGVLKDPEIYEALSATLFGQRSSLHDGKHAGRNGKAAINGAGTRVL